MDRFNKSSRRIVRDDKFMKKFMLLLVIFIFLFTSSLLSNDFTFHTNAIKKIYEEEQKSEDTIQNWKSGVTRDYSYTLVFITIDFEFVAGKVIDEDQVIIGGITTTTAHCYTKEENKVRIVQMAPMIFLMSNDGQIKRSLIVGDISRSIRPGWDGKDC